ncbi:hypothetical protein HYT55_00090 [Candidatus Woesearchaeota archaeon]|nr:hypothetical protein [Candidatus Woesearchaeota archaeon]
MAVQQSRPATRYTKSSTSSVPPVQGVTPIVQHKGRMIGLIIFAVVLIVAITLLILYGKQFAGKAIAVAPGTLLAGQAGIPLDPTTTMAVGETQDLSIYVNLGAGDAYGFHFVLRYDPQVVEITSASDITPAYPGITLLNVQKSMVGNLEQWDVAGGVTELIAEKPMKTLKEIGSPKSTVALVKVTLKAKSDGLSGLTFTMFEVYDKTTGQNLVTKTQPEKSFSVVTPVCDKGNPELCTSQQACNSVGFVWNTVNNHCYAHCPDGTLLSADKLLCLPLQEICTDGLDNDNNGKIDCSDSKCYSSSACYQKQCAVATDCGVGSGEASWLCVQNRCYLQMKTGAGSDADLAACKAAGFTASNLGWVNNQFVCVQCSTNVDCPAGNQCVDNACVLVSPQCLDVSKITTQTGAEAMQSAVCQSTGCTFSSTTKQCTGTAITCPDVVKYTPDTAYANGVRKSLCESVPGCVFKEGPAGNPTSHVGDSCTLVQSSALLGDTNNSECIDIDEVLTYIDAYYTGNSISIDQVLSVIDNYYSADKGC